MEVMIGRELVQVKRIKIRDNQAEIQGQLYNAKHNIVLPVGGDYFDVFLLYDNFNQIKKKFNFTDIDLVIESDSMNFQVNYEYDNRTFRHLFISMGDFYLKNFNEADLLVFLCHELGHILDVKNIYNSDKNNFIRLKLLRFFYIFIIILLTSVLKKYEFNNYIFMSIFIMMNLSLALFLKLLNKLKLAMESRKQEYVADKYAVQVMGDLMLVLAAYNKLSVVMNDNDSRSFFSSHPSLKQRIRRLKFRYWYLYLWNKIFSH